MTVHIFHPPPDVEHGRRLYWEADELESDGPNVRSWPPHRAPVKLAPDRRASFALPIMGALSGAVWSVLLAAIIGWHFWLIAPVAFGAAYGFLVTGGRG
jgi:hypothetical protein